MDYGYLKRQRAATPKQVHHQVLVACNTIESGGASLMVTPRTHHVNNQRMDEMTAPEIAEYEATKAGKVWSRKLAEEWGPELGEGGMEVLLEEGDLVAFDTMTVR